MAHSVIVYAQHPNQLTRQGNKAYKDSLFSKQSNDTETHCSKIKTHTLHHSILLMLYTNKNNTKNQHLCFVHLPKKHIIKLTNQKTTTTLAIRY